MGAEMTSQLRAMASLSGVPAALELASLPSEPSALFESWLSAARLAGVPEPHSMTLATVDAAGTPDARTLLLKDLDHRGWAFAGPRTSAKGDQLAACPAAALNFWWQPVVRAVRVRGPVIEASLAECAADLAARPASARAQITDGDWVLWRVVPERVEFWQGSPDRRHTRIVFEHTGDAWKLTIDDPRAAR